MTPEEKKQIETQIQNDFSELQKKLENLKSEVQSETDESKKQKKNNEIQKLEKDLSDIKTQIDTLSSLQESDLQSLKTKLEETKKAYQEYKWEVTDLQKERTPVPTTYELLKDSETYNRLLNIISSNPDKFKNLPWENAEKKLEYIFEKIHNSVILFMKNKLWNTENTEKVITNTISPAFEWSLMELLRDQWNETNVGMLQWMDKISRGSFGRLVSWVWDFAKKATWSYNKFSQWINAVDYLSVHNWVLNNPSKSEVLSNPLKFKEYMNDARFSAEGFSPYANIPDNIFKVDENQTFEFGMSLQEKQSVLAQIWDIQVVNNPRTTALIARMLDKPEQFLQKASWLQQTANGLLDWIDSLNSATKMFWVDILWEITKAPEKRSFLYRIIDFICKLIWITWWLEWVVKKWRLDRLKLTDEKNENITQIITEYQKKAWEWKDLSVTDANSCTTALAEFTLTDLDKDSTTKWDHLRDVMAENMNINLLHVGTVQQTLWNSYLKKEIVNVNWNQQERIVVDTSKITEDNKKELAHKHIINMKNHLGNYNDLKDFYENIHNMDDLALCMTTALYADKTDIIEWVKAKIFLPENYRTIRSDWTVVETDAWKEKLDSKESSDKQVVNEQWVYDKAKEYWITDNKQIAYVLSTIKWESWFKNKEEDWKWSWKDYWNVDSETKKAYYWRWFVQQLTGKDNYQKFTEIIKKEKKNFKDNEGKELKEDIDLVNEPDLILRSNELAIFITMYWMKNGSFTGKKLGDFISETESDFYNARSIVVNWDDNKAQEYANNAKRYLYILNQQTA